jgi:hypothetical protein
MVPLQKFRYPKVGPKQQDSGVQLKATNLMNCLFKAMVDKLCFLAVYGSKSTLEARVPASIRAAFHKLTLDRHKAEGARDQFAAAWKAYRANPEQDHDENLAAEEALFAMLGADSDGEGGPAGGGAVTAEATPPP